MQLSRRAMLGASAAIPLAGLATASLADAHAAAPGPYGMPIATDFPFEKKRAAILDSDMAYVDEGAAVVRVALEEVWLVEPLLIDFIHHFHSHRLVIAGNVRRQTGGLFVGVF